MGINLRVMERIRSAAGAYLNSRALIEKETRAVGLMGEAVRGWVTVASNVPCRVIQASTSRNDQTSLSGAVEALPAHYRIALPAGTSIDVDHRVTVLGVTYYVVGLEPALTDAMFVMVQVVAR